MRVSDHSRFKGHAHSESDPQPKGPIGWVRRLFQPPPAPCSAEPGSNVHEDDTFSFTTPAKGDAFDFTVTAFCSWCAEGDRASSGLRADIAEQRMNARQRIQEKVRAEARKYPPFRPHQAEEAVNEMLRAELLGAVHQCDEVTVRCTARVEVGLTEDVREQQRELGRKLLLVEAEAELTSLRIVKMDELRKEWLRFFEEGKDDWRTRHAVQLAEYPQDVSNVITNMLNERRQEAVRLLETIDNMVAAQRTTNVYDLVIGSETVLRKTLDVLGIPVAPTPPDSPFAPMEEAS